MLVEDDKSVPMKVSSSMTPNPLRNRASESEYVEMRNECFSPHKYADDFNENIQRVGVPGHELFEHDISILKLWNGSSIQQVWSSGMFLFYIGFLAIVLSFFSVVKYDNSLRGTNLNSELKSSINSLCIFILTFFMSATISKVNTRFENVCKTNGYVTRLSALAGTLYAPREAKAIMRYTNSILHIYYLLMSGPMNNEKWNKLYVRGLLTKEEIEKLQLQGSPGVIIYTWALHILKFNTNEKDLKDHNKIADTEQALNATNAWAQGMVPYQLNMETCIGGTRGLAAKQIAYSLFQTPLLYYHAVYTAVTIYLLCTCYDTGHLFARGLNEPCHLIVDHPTPNSIDDDGNHLQGSCYSNCMTVVLSQLVLLTVFLSILKAAEKLSDAYGPKAYHYDLGVDLDNLWKESQNVMKSMDVPRPSY